MAFLPLSEVGQRIERVDLTFWSNGEELDLLQKEDLKPLPGSELITLSQKKLIWLGTQNMKLLDNTKLQESCVCIVAGALLGP